MMLHVRANLLTQRFTRCKLYMDVHALRVASFLPPAIEVITELLNRVSQVNLTARRPITVFENP
jgi:hypothetical protein